MYNKQLNTQYFNILKSLNYKYSKDQNGFYFDNGKDKFSVTKIGVNLFQCYHNQISNNQWVLKSKSNIMNDFLYCLMWIVNEINRR